jgi:hypothetical protein
MPESTASDPKRTYEALCAQPRGVVPASCWTALARDLELAALTADVARQGGLHDRAADCRHRAMRLESMERAA